MITSGADIGGMGVHPRIAALEAEVAANPGPIVRDPAAVDRDPGPVPALVTTDDVLEALRGMSSSQRKHLLTFLAGYDTNAVATAIAWLQRTGWK